MRQKRFLSWLLTLCLMLGMFSFPAYAEGNTTTISGDGTAEKTGTMTITLVIPKKTPAATDLTYTAPSDLVYSGSNKAATIAAASGVTGLGTITVKYYSDASRTTEATPKNVGTYYVGATVAEGDQYAASTGVLYGDGWTFTITASTPSAPAAPTKASATKNSITLNAVSGCEYSKDGTNWQSGTEFTGLTPGMEYTFYQRVKATANTNASPASSAKFSTTADTYAMTITLVIPNTYTVTYKVVNGTWLDGTTADKTETVQSGSKPASVPTGMIASSGYTGGAWNTNPADATITEATTFTYTFTAIPTYEVTYKVVNGTWSDDSTADKTETVQSGSKPASVPTGMKASEGYTGGAWDTDPVEATITGATTFTYSFVAKTPISQTVTFKVVNGSWDDGNSADITVTLTGLEGDTLKLTADQIPAVGTKPADTFKEGAWDVVPSTETAITAATTYTYTYAAKDSISQTVTFKVVNGSWDDGTTEDKTVTLTGLEGDTLKLAANQILAVGNKPGDTFKAGAWDVVPSAETAITAATTYTYTYAAKDSISQTVTFKVVNGSWDNGDTADITVTLTGLEGDTLKLAENQIPAVGTKPADTYKAGAWDVVPSTETAITAATTYTYSYAAKDSISQTVTFKVVNGSWDNGNSADITVTLTGLEGDTLKLAENQIPAVGTKPGDTFKAGAWDVVPSTETAITAATTYTYTYAAKNAISQTVTFKVVNGSWDDGNSADITVTLTGLEGDTLKLAENQIPAVGTKPGDTFKAGAWDVVPSTETAITAATTYTYTYAAKDAISQTVTFKVVNGSWDNGDTADITVTLTGLEGDTLKLTANQIPAVGTKPADTYKAGAWDVVPSTETAITAATTYTYTYAAKDYTAAQGVIDAINALPDPTDVTTANKDAIEAARAAYDALPEDQKAKVEADTLKKLADAEAALKAIADAGKLYYTVSGDGQDHVIESGEDATFTVKRSVADENTFSRFTGIQLDGADVDESNYDKSEGSVIIKLKAAYLDTLSVGSHILKVLFTDGSVEIPFEVSVPVIVDPTSFEDIAVPSKTFTFKKVWEGGSEKSIDFTLYKLGDTVYHHGFDKKIISKTEWQYNAWFSEAVACYVIEEPVEGYKTRYENVGVYAGITDRCCDGGTIVNYKVPKTGDSADLMLWLGCALAGLALISASVYAGKRKKAHSK